MAITNEKETKLEKLFRTELQKQFCVVSESVFKLAVRFVLKNLMTVLSR